MKPLPKTLLLIILGLIIASNISIDQEVYGNFILLEAPIISYQASNTVLSVVSAYNSLEWQTDSTPCIGAGGYICDRDNVVANNCLELGTLVEINGKVYEVYDRMNKKYSCNYYDIYMGMDLQGAKEFGRQTLEVIIYK